MAKRNNIISKALGDGNVKNLMSSIKLVDTGKLVPGGPIIDSWSESDISSAAFALKKAFNFKVQTNTDEFIKYFGLRSVEFGNWMSFKDRLEFLFAVADGLKVIADTLNISPVKIGYNKTLSIMLGARGRAKTSAIYQPVNKYININKPQGTYGSLFHEVIHYFDNIIGEKSGKKLAFISGGQSTDKNVDIELYQNKGFAGLLERLFEALYWNDGKKTAFYHSIMKAQNTDSKYWGYRAEVLARTGEVWLKDSAKKSRNLMLIQGSNSYSRKSSSAIVYPKDIDLERVKPYFDDFIRMIGEFLSKPNRAEPKHSFEKKMKPPTTGGSPKERAENSLKVSSHKSTDQFNNKYTLVKETDKAILIKGILACEFTDQTVKSNLWIPKSLLRADGAIPEWYLEKKVAEAKAKHAHYSTALDFELV